MMHDPVELPSQLLVCYMQISGGEKVYRKMEQNEARIVVVMRKEKQTR